MAGRTKTTTYIITDLMGQSIEYYYELIKDVVNFPQQTCFQSRISFFPIRKNTYLQ
jgi:hypothetical protein